MKEYILSICIPTRNRADVLIECIDSIVNSSAFNEDIEIVVSDNASTDNTSDVMSNYTSKYANVKYFRNNSDIGQEGNFIRSISIANGCFRKLNNDYSVFTEDGLKTLYNAVVEHMTDKPQLLFQNMPNTKYHVMKELSLDDVIEYEGWGLSWIGVFGFWAEDWNRIDCRELLPGEWFGYLDQYLRISTFKKHTNICIAQITTRYPFKQKQGGYNFFEVHTLDYLSHFEAARIRGDISQKSYDILVKKTFEEELPFLTKFLITEKNNFTYEMNRWWLYFFKAYGRYSWFYKKMIKWSLVNLKYVWK